MTENTTSAFEISREIWGSTQLRTHDVEFKTYKNVFYIPFSPHVFFDRYQDWGLYDQDGYLIEQAAYRRDGALIGQQQRIDLRRFQFEEDNSEALVYGGPIIPHYGHFLLSSIARFWKRSVDGKVVYHSDPPLFDHAMPYVVELLRAMGHTPSNATSFHKPTRLKKILVAQPCFEEQGFVFPTFATTGLQIGRGLSALSTDFELEEGANVFLSKSCLADGITNFSNEADLDHRLRDAGFVVIHPQNLSLSAQVEIFKKAGVIVGFEGSAFHTQVLYPHATARRLVLSPAGFINSNFLLLDKAWGRDATYADVSSDVDGSKVNASFFKTYRIKDADALARRVGAWVRAAIPTRGFRETNEMCRHADSLDNLKGENYHSTLLRVGEAIQPMTYFEIGTLQGETLKLFDCVCLAVDPKFQINKDVIGRKPLCTFYQGGSDEFFARTDPRTSLGGPIDLAFLDGMHQCEFLLRDFLNTERFCRPDSVIILHDCVPVELPMTSRTQNAVPAEDPSRAGWWTGDVWKTALLLKEYRRDLAIFTVDSQPTGLVVITNLSPGNDAWHDQYDGLLPIMNDFDCSLREAHARLNVQPAESLISALADARRKAVHTSS